jgi:hypothetical protein
MLRDFLRFIEALWREWRVLLTGGSIFAGLALWTMATGKPVAQNVNWLILGLTLILASFFAWRKEWISGGSGFIEVDLYGLVQVFSGRTKIQAGALVKPYIGKWVMIAGELNDISLIWHAAMVYVEAPQRPQFGGSLRFNMWRWQASKLSALPRGTRITIAGRISEIDGLGVSLSGSQVLAIEPKQEVPQPPKHDLSGLTPSQE